MLLPMFVSAIVGFAIAIVLVEKQKQWPATVIRPILSRFLSKIYHKLPEMLECSVCTSFWASLVADCMVSLYTRFQYIPSWPLSGFIAVAISWTIIQILDAMDWSKSLPPLPPIEPTVDALPLPTQQ